MSKKSQFFLYLILLAVSASFGYFAADELVHHLHIKESEIPKNVAFSIFALGFSFFPLFFWEIVKP